MNIEKYEVDYNRLKNKINIDRLDFNTTQDLKPLEGIIGQNRATDALEFGLDIKKNGYNIFVSGQSGTGRNSYVHAIAKEKAKENKRLDDWVYVRNFQKPDSPIALNVKSGKGKILKENIGEIIEKFKKEIPQIFMSKEYENQKNALILKYQNYTKEGIEALNSIAKQYGFIFSKTERGLVTMPLKEGKALNEEEYKNLSTEETEALRGNSANLSVESIEGFNKLRALEEEFKVKVKELDKKIGDNAVDFHISKMKEKFSDSECVRGYLDELKEDIVEHIDEFKSEKNKDAKNPLAIFQMKSTDSFFDRYKVNLFIDHSELDHAPIINETNPNYYNLIGRIEYKNELGAMKTDITQIKPGALHRANGGYLILQAKDLLANSFAWDALKRVLKTNKIKIEGLDKQYGSVVTSTLKPEPITIDIKVILIGDPYTYQLLYHYDEDFKKLFKIMADFDIEMDRNDENIYKMARFIATHCEKENLKHFDKLAVAKIIEYSSRIAENQKKLSAQFNKVVEIVYEADRYAKKMNDDIVHIEHVNMAISNKIKRNNKYEEKILEMFEDGTLLLEVEGKKVGEINGLAVTGTGEYSFGKPSKITVTTYIGKDGIINIEREVKKSGSIHDKGVLILNGYIGSKFAKERHLALSANIVFEQLYSGIDGDSASSTELYALLSSLSEVPIKQSIAVTGSVNQRGEIQPIGGVNEKIEGFYKVCKVKGLTGDQGVMIPHQNVRNLMLREEVIEAIEKGIFHIYAIQNIEEGIEILTGMKAVGEDGAYLEGTVFYLVNEKLKKFSAKNKKEETSIH